MRAEIIKSGIWMYDEQIPYEVWVVKQDFDYGYEEGFEDGPEQLNTNGEMFQILIYRESEGRYPVGPGCFTLSDAIRTAEQTLIPAVAWDDHRLQSLFDGRDYRLSPRTNV